MDHRKKYPGEERRLRDLGDILRVASAPRVGNGARVNGQPVKLNEALVLDLLRRREAGTENDGLRSRSYDPTRAGGGGGVKPVLNEETGEWEYPVSSAQPGSTLVESAALRGLPGADDDRKDDWRRHEQPDPVGQLIEECLAEFDTMARASRRFEVKLMRILNAGDGRRGRQSSLGQCQACGRDVPGTSVDRLRSGYCDRVAGPPVGPAWSGCYRMWIDQGRPDRVRFEQWVQGEINGDGPGYGVHELDALVANGTLPSAS